MRKVLSAAFLIVALSGGIGLALDLKSWFEIFGGPSTAPAIIPSPPPPTGFFVATNGNDSNPGTIASPFATIPRALTAMQGSSTKITYIRAGTYFPTSMTTMLVADNGETLSYYPPDGYNTAIIDGTNQTPVRSYSLSYVGDANGNLSNAFLLLINGASNVTINGLVFQNAWGGVAVHGGNCDSGWGTPGGNCITATTGPAHNDIIENNILHHFTYVPSQTADPFPNFMTPIEMHGDVQGGQILHNVVYDVQTQGITGGVGNGPMNGANNLVIDSNVVYNVNQSTSDTGGICFEDRYTQTAPAQSTNIKIHNNYVRDASQQNPSQQSRCFYYDDFSSNILMTQNICTGSMNTGVIIHDSTNVVMTGNIFDYVLGADVAAEAILNLDPLPYQAMTGNVFTGNIILNGNTSSGGNGYQVGGGGASPTFYTWTPPLIEHNLYYSYPGAQSIYTGGAFSVANIVSSVEPNGGTGDPFPVTGTNPLCSGGLLYHLGSGSPAFNSPVNFVQIPGGWGPPGYSIPAGPKPPSCPP